jgi:DNA-binding CsgD family transcriptional regulator
MTPQQALAAEADTQPLEGVYPGSPARPLPARASALPGLLTEREVEVLRLLAQGLSNNQIAELLVLSPYTVNKHTQAIYGKLSVNSRSTATRYAIVLRTSKGQYQCRHPLPQTPAGLTCDTLSLPAFEARVWPSYWHKLVRSTVTFLKHANRECFSDVFSLPKLRRTHRFSSCLSQQK